MVSTLSQHLHCYSNIENGVGWQLQQSPKAPAMLQDELLASTVGYLTETITQNASASTTQNANVTTMSSKAVTRVIATARGTCAFDLRCDTHGEHTILYWLIVAIAPK